MAQTSQNDDNMVPGQTYTFTFVLGNWITMPSVATILQDIQAQAPDFIQNASASWSSGLWITTNYLNVTFTYGGDGSDVISDVGAALVAAFATGSNDTFTFQSANASGVGVTVGMQVQAAAGAVTQAAGGALSSVTSSVASGAQNLLTPVEIALGIVVVLAVVLIYTIGKSGGLKTPALSIG